MPGVSNILVVDDDPGIRLYLRRRLSLAEYDVVQASQAALAAIGQQPSDAIILGDLAALAAIRSMDAISSAPVLALLEGGDAAAVVAALDAGVDQCLSKPFAIGEVRAWLRAALRRSGADTFVGRACLRRVWGNPSAQGRHYLRRAIHDLRQKT